MTTAGEINLIVSSDPEAGAINTSSDGSYFEIYLQDGGIQVPKTATQCYLSVPEAVIWNVVPNILTGVNDMVHITGPEGVEEVSNHNLGYSQTAIIEATTGTDFTITGSLSYPLPGAIFQNGDIIKVEATGQEYIILSITTDTTLLFSCVTSNSTILPPNTGNFSRLRGGTGVKDYDIQLPQGLYDLNRLNSAIQTSLENQGASYTAEPVISFIADTASQRVLIRFPFPSTSIDFSRPNTFYEILGFNPIKYGPFPSTAPISVLAPYVANFNVLDYFLLCSDIGGLGLRFNSQYNQVISQVLITASPGSQVIARPFLPARLSVPELIGATRTSIRVWLTDQRNKRVNTNSEYYSARIRIEYS